MQAPVTPFISLQTASSLTGVSVRTLWRRIANGELRTCKENGPSGRTLVALEDLLLQSRVLVSGEDFDIVVAADAGDPEAQCELGLAFMLAGHAEEAVGWFKAAAERFSPDALHQLGRCCLSGVGVERDERVGRQYVARAAERGHTVAVRLLEYLDQPGRPALAPAVLEYELDAIERRIVLDALAVSTGDAHDRKG